MATQNSTITVKGKLGNIVGYKGRGGKRLARIRQTEVKNPKTDGQIIQRMILATASKAYGRMKSICDHSWQGVAYGGMSQSYFLKKAIERIRKFVADSMAAFPSSILDPLQWVGLARPDRLAEAGYGLQISEGTIPSVSANYETEGEGEDEEKVLHSFGASLGVAGATLGVAPAGGYTILQVLKALGAKVGDQLTIVGIMKNGEFVKSRYITKANATEAELAVAWTPNGSAAAFDAETEVSPNLMIKPETNTQHVGWDDSAGSSAVAVAIVISRKVDNTWQRSTQYLMPVREVSGVDAIIKLWQLGTTEIPTANPYYLNNADLAGE